MVADWRNVNEIHVTPVAFESLGVRSMCTFVETPDIRVLIDPGAALGPRFRLLPHPREYEALRRAREKIRKYAKIANVLVVSHYHHDHFTPNFTDTTWLASNPREAGHIYGGKRIMVKDVRSSINASQRRRGWIFQSFCRKIESEIVTADGESFEYGSTKLRFSTPLPHGQDESSQGWVLATIVELARERFMHASDVQGPMSDSALQFILNERPSTLIVGGPPMYLSGVKVPESSIKKGMENLDALAKSIPLVIADHHLLRDRESNKAVATVCAAVRPLGHLVQTAAEYVGEQTSLLEANRAGLYKDDPPSKRFVKWTKLPREKQLQVLPPIGQERTKRGEVQGH